MSKLLDRKTFFRSPAPGAAAVGFAANVAINPARLVSYESRVSRSDTVDHILRRLSDDGGLHWGEAETIPCVFKRGDAMERIQQKGVFVDPATGRCVSLWSQATLPTNNPLEHMTHCVVRYTVSEDGEATHIVDEQIIHHGDFDSIHHFPGITFGKNCLMIGDWGSAPLVRADGAILVPAQSSPVGSDGNYHNPTGSYTYTDALVLIARWRDDKRLSWSCSARVEGNPARSTRGMIEPTLGELADGRLLMLMRGSNDCKPELPGHRWAALSRDGGETWTSPEPWTYHGGEAFHSPSSMSRLLRHSSGKLLWLGNLCPANPNGNSPRHPIVMGEVDLKDGGLVKSSLLAFDDRQEGESPHLTLSNFHARENRLDGTIRVYVPRFFAQDWRKDDKIDWTGDTFEYVLEP